MSVIGRAESEQVWIAALAGVPELAREIERQGLFLPTDSLEAARALRPGLLKVGPRILQDLPRTRRSLRRDLERRQRDSE